MPQGGFSILDLRRKSVALMTHALVFSWIYAVADLFAEKKIAEVEISIIKDLAWTVLIRIPVTSVATLVVTKVHSIEQFGISVAN